MIAASKMIIRKTPRVRHRGVPPPAVFDIDQLPGSALLTTAEVAGLIRRSISAVEMWRKNPAHPLKWTPVDGRPLYRVDAVRAFLASQG